MIVFSFFVIEPLFDAARMEEMPAHWNSANLFAVGKPLEADDTFISLEFIIPTVKLHNLKQFNEFLNVCLLFLRNLLFKIAIDFISLHQLDLPLKSPDIVNSYDILIPVWIWLVYIEIDMCGMIDVALNARSHEAAAEEGRNYCDCRC